MSKTQEKAPLQIVEPPGGPVAGDDYPRKAELVVSRAPLAIGNTAALAPTTSGQLQLASELDELELWLSYPFVSPRAIAAQTEAAQLDASRGKEAELFLFTLHRWGETEFERENDMGELVIEPAYLWLCTAQTEIVYVNNTGDPVEIAAGERFIISQRPNRLRARVVEKICAILQNEGAIPNVTMTYTRQSKKAAAKGWSRATTFRPIAPVTVGAS